MKQMTKGQDAAPLLHAAAGRLIENGYDTPARDARQLLGLALGRDAPVYPHEKIELSAAAAARFDDFISQRLGGKPVSRIRSTREFYGLDFSLNAATLDPRPDSETLVEAALNWLRLHKPDAPRILDLGTGTGCLLLSVLAHWPDASGVGVDCAPDAAAMAQQNAESLGLQNRARFIIDDWGKTITEEFDLILSNPPYIARSDIADLMPEVRLFDPMLALDGGTDGYDAWRQLAAILPQPMKKHAACFVEIGQGQASTVKELMAKQGLFCWDSYADLSGITRCLAFKHK